jgi:cell division protein FtsB
MSLSNSDKSLVSKAKWPLFLMANLAVLLVVGVATVRESYRGWTVDNEIQNLELKAQALEGQKMQISTMAAKMQDTSYVEREARLKLGLQKPGEHVVVLEGVSATQTVWNLDIVNQPTPSDTMSNPQRWWRYFTQGGS